MMRRTALVTLLLALAACGEKSPPPAPTPPPPAAPSYADKMAQEHAHDSPAPSPATAMEPSSAVAAEPVTYGQIDGKELIGYLAYPADSEGALPAVLMFHEWWGLNENIKSMARQLAGEGYAVLAADLFGGRVAEAPDAAKNLMQEASGKPQDIASNLRQAHAYVARQVKAAKIGTIGWCFGGAQSLRMALLQPEQVDATVIYYGHLETSPDELRKLQMPILGFFGALDQGVPVAGVREFEQALKQLGKPAEIHVYDGADHAFANPSGGNYKASAAEDAWKRTLAFFERHLRPAGEETGEAPATEALAEQPAPAAEPKKP